MPVVFLTPAQRERYGRYPDLLPADELARCFHLDDDDREWIVGKRRDSNRLPLQQAFPAGEYIRPANAPRNQLNLFTI
jgi:hypothetical protein